MYSHQPTKTKTPTNHTIGAIPQPSVPAASSPKVSFTVKANGDLEFNGEADADMILQLLDAAQYNAQRSKIPSQPMNKAPKPLFADMLSRCGYVEGLIIILLVTFTAGTAFNALMNRNANNLPQYPAHYRSK